MIFVICFGPTVQLAAPADAMAPLVVERPVKAKPSPLIQSALDQRLADLSQQIVAKIGTGQKRTVAVLEFGDLQGNVTDFGRYLAEELITRLYDTGKFKVIERQLLNRVIAEQKLSLTGVVDPASAMKLGSLLGVEAIVSGSVADRGESLKINARIISTSTGEIVSAAAVDMAKDREVTALMGNGSGERSGPSVASPHPPAAGLPDVVTGVFRFELKKCQLAGDVMDCSLTITNGSDTDRHFNLFGKFYGKAKWSRAISSASNEYGPSTLWLGENQGANVAQSILVARTPVNAILRFRDVAPDTTRLSLLRVTFNEGEYTGSGRYADFHDVAVAK
jgi:curli biogenesis system outer membrane secretion channel CsgG